ncbi:MAG: DUF421 domain-containing protein [Clostridia bacterium]|nr:DUF421 domain-containing protein [Clostridia bacterium]
MLIPFARTLILYLSIILALRLMGKRQVGEMQPSELVVTILVSAVASVPMQDIDIPLSHGLVPVLTLIAAEVLISALTLKSSRLRQLLSGKPVPVICSGRLDQNALKKLRLSTDDLLEDLRLNGIFDLRQVQFAQLETNGQLSVLLRSGDAPATPSQLGQKVSQALPMHTLVADGALREDSLRQLGQSRDWLERILKAGGIRQLKEVFLFCADQKGDHFLIKKER